MSSSPRKKVEQVICLKIEIKTLESITVSVCTTRVCWASSSPRVRCDSADPAMALPRLLLLFLLGIPTARGDLDSVKHHHHHHSGFWDKKPRT